MIKYFVLPDFDYQCMTVLHVCHMIGASGKCELELVDIIGVSTSPWCEINNIKARSIIMKSDFYLSYTLSGEQLKCDNACD